MAAIDADLNWSVALLMTCFFEILVVALTTLASMHHLRKSSKSLENIGIYNNSVQMNIYVICWIILGVVFLSVTVMSIYMNNLLKSAKVAYINAFFVIRMAITLYILVCVLFMLTILLDFLVLSTYLRYCDKL